MGSIPKYKLHYFDFYNGKAEPLRWMMEYAGVDWEDHRIKELPYYIVPAPTPEWNELKPKMPFGVLPALEVNGKYLGETHAIARYLAGQLGLAGANAWEAARADSIISYICADYDCYFMDWVREMYPEKKTEYKDRLIEKLPQVAETLEKLLKENNPHGAPNGLYVGKTLTVADFFSAAFYDTNDLFLVPGSMAQYPYLTAHHHLMKELPRIKEYIHKQAD